MTFPKFNAESLGFVVTVLFVLASISASYGVSQHQLNRHEVRLAEVEDRVMETEKVLIEVATNVRWIRDQIANHQSKK
tara:strand:- start:275 stop:508 length:234 start_codon:yes stop_codon:yes gene_type:complete